MIFLSDISWIEAVDLKIFEIDRDATSKKKKVLKAEMDTFFYERYKLNHIEKLHLHYSSSFVDSMNVFFYKENDFIFGRVEFYVAEYFHKGAPYPNRPVGEITEIKSYFQTDTNGIQLKRTIDYLENSNKDSLIRLLNKLVYDTTFLDAIDYQKVTRHYKHARKHC
jgi:hypothetical protein